MLKLVLFKLLDSYMYIIATGLQNVTCIIVVMCSPLHHRSWDKDRYFAPDINAVTLLLAQGKVSRHLVEWFLN